MVTAADPAWSPARTRGCSIPLPSSQPESVADELAAVHGALADPNRARMLPGPEAAAPPILVCELTAAAAALGLVP